MYDVKSPNAREFISHEEIMATLAWVQENKNNSSLIGEILEKASEKKGLHHREAALLLTSGDNEKLFCIAREIKREFYGDRVVLFAPLYLSNYCVNGCVYCPFNAKNNEMPRKKLSQDEIRREVTALQDMGHKRLVIETGEHPGQNPIEYVLESIKTIYGIHHKNGAIRRVNVNVAAATTEDYRKLKEAGIGTYLLFQETYHEETYNRIHPSGPKSCFARHTEAIDRAMQGGIDDIGLGVLFGLADCVYEFVALLMHAEHLEAVYGVGPHTLSVPRIRRAQGVDESNFTHGVDDDTFARIVACLRISAPYTGIIISTRESGECRKKVLDVGVSQISGGSRTSVGGYDPPETAEDTRQFEISDNRSLDEIVNWLINIGYIPSFCTACYREGRVGDRFMKLCKTGQIQNCCHPNALLTLQEYLIDYAESDTRAAGERLISREILKITNEKTRTVTLENLEKIKKGSRDFRI
ncbi:MAG: [FeFe] hydrogenase H-cluster radical SAM maturase HydG [Oscillospiraceae bacterium]|jgi:2-iminoacetate synthase|nr:[FeFe] hydrogenase H-cluster radical SAM maturase HydG [Oscillospiraceae bacterium]